MVDSKVDIEQFGDVAGNEAKVRPFIIVASDQKYRIKEVTELLLDLGVERKNIITVNSGRESFARLRDYNGKVGAVVTGLNMSVRGGPAGLTGLNVAYTTA